MRQFLAQTLAEKIGISPVNGVGLIYYEPQTDLTVNQLDQVLLDAGFREFVERKIKAGNITKEEVWQIVGLPMLFSEEEAGVVEASKVAREGKRILDEYLQ